MVCRTTGEVIADLITKPRLAAVLSAQWGTYGGRPGEGSFSVHATVIGHYLEGAGYPAGGAGAIARGLVPVIESAGGRALAGTPVRRILIEDERAVGVQTSSGEQYRAPVIVSAVGARETVMRLLRSRSLLAPTSTTPRRSCPSGRIWPSATRC